jgi:hypothetical protein
MIGVICILITLERARATMEMGTAQSKRDVQQFEAQQSGDVPQRRARTGLATRRELISQTR